MKADYIPVCYNIVITGDYNDFFDFEREDVLPLLELTRKLLAKLESLIAHP